MAPRWADTGNSLSSRDDKVVTAESDKKGTDPVIASLITRASANTSAFSSKASPRACSGAQ